MESVEEMCDYIALINKSEKILDGEKSKIKNDFKSNQYTLIHRGNGIASNETFNMENKSDLGEGLQKSTLKLLAGASSNQLLQELINQKVDIISFQEEIPSINDIFIQLVQGDKQSIPTS
jgi:ABC-2 type transport system ATP-binding protein